MSRFILISSFAALLVASYAQSVKGIESTNQTAWAQSQLACADVGIDPGSSAFGECVIDLYYSLWNEENEFER